MKGGSSPLPEIVLMMDRRTDEILAPVEQILRLINLQVVWLGAL